MASPDLSVHSSPVQIAFTSPEPTLGLVRPDLTAVIVDRLSCENPGWEPPDLAENRTG